MTILHKLPVLRDESEKTLSQQQVDEINFPNKKGHISYSEVIDWVECSYRHKLKHVDKIDLDGDSIHTIFGGLVHDALESYLKTRVLPDTDEYVKKFIEVTNAMEPGARKEQALNLRQEFVENMPDMIKAVPPWLDSVYPGWELVAAEHYLYEEIEKTGGVRFKGYVDNIIRVEKQPTKKFLKECEAKGIEVPKQFTYVILDWKTCSWGWKTEMKRKFEKQMQLMLYKHYFAKETGISLDDIKCGFVLVKRTNKKDRVEFVPVSVGPKAIDKSLLTLRSMINQTKMGLTTKNRRSCKPFCPYLNSVHCR